MMCAGGVRAVASPPDGRGQWKKAVFLLADQSQQSRREDLLSKTKTGRRKNIVPLEVKSAKRYTQVSLDKFRQYIDRPTVLDVNDRHAKDGVTYLPIYATPAFLEGI